DYTREKYLLQDFAKKIEPGNKEKGREQQQLPSITNLQKNVDLDETWEKIQRAIQKVAKSTLSKKEKTPKLQDHQIENEELKNLRKDIKVMGKWCRKLKKPSHFEKKQTHMKS
ncbi:9442_t:CDS:2, partial [Dentiscutata heterogama]